MDQWGVGRVGIDDGLVILFDLDTTGIHGEVQLFAGPGFSSRHLSDDERQAIYEGTMLPLLAEQRVRPGASSRRWPRSSTGPSTAPPTRGRRAHADRHRPARRSPTRSTARSTTSPAIFAPEAIARAEATIDAIEARTGAEVVVYTPGRRLRRDDRGDRGARHRAHRPVGHRPARVRRRDGRVLRPRPVAASTARSSCTPRPASRRRS